MTDQLKADDAIAQKAMPGEKTVIADDDDDDDDPPVLSEFALAALKEFYEEQKQYEETEKDAAVMPKEDWQLSQFWYTEESARRLADEAIAVIGEEGKVACLCCPSIHKKIVELGRGHQSKVMEIDRRFSDKFHDQYVYYDYKDPVNFPEDLKKSFDLVIADPPFLNEECLSKAAQSVQLLAKDRIMLCTGERMQDLAKKLLNVEPCSYIPQHHQLANEFRCYTNYKPITLVDEK